QDLFWGWWSVSDFDCLLSIDMMWSFYNPSTPANALPPCVGFPGIYAPGNPIYNCHVHHAYSMHSGGSNMGLGDGSVRFVPFTAQNIMRFAAPRANGEVYDSIAVFGN